MLIASKEVLINSIIFYLDEGCEIDNHRVDPQHVTDKAELLESGVLAFVESWHSGNFSEGNKFSFNFFSFFSLKLFLRQSHPNTLNYFSALQFSSTPRFHTLPAFQLSNPPKQWYARPLLRGVLSYTKSLPPL